MAFQRAILLSVILTPHLGQILSYLKINFTREITSPNSPTTAVLPTMTHPILSCILGAMIPSPTPTISAVYIFNRKGKLKRPLFACSVSAGFPSPADDYIEGRLDLNELMVPNPAATFFVRVAGDSMIGAGIHHNDILVVDRSLDPTSGKVVIAVVNNELTVKRLVKNGENICLKAESPDYPDIHMTEGNTCEIWGVVAFVVHSL